MLVKSQPTEVWAFHDSISTSSGTADMVWIARKAGLPVTIITTEMVLPQKPKGPDQGTLW